MRLPQEDGLYPLLNQCNQGGIIMIQDDKNLYPEAPNEWLYADEGDTRNFWGSITLPREEDAKWYSECTNEEKEQWEREHTAPKQPEQEE